GFAGDLFRPECPAGEQDLFRIFRIGCDDAEVLCQGERVGLDLKRGPALEPSDRLLRHSFRDRMSSVELGAKDRAGNEEVFACETACHIFYREIELLDSEVRCAVEE